MNDVVPPRHPEAQTMAAFVDGTLAPQEVAAVADHLRDCADCRIVVSETARFEREEEKESQPRRNLWWLAAAAAIVIAVVIAVPLLRPRTPLERLIHAAPRSHRNVEARLSGFPWARLQAPSRGTPVPDPSDMKLTGAAGEVLEKNRDGHAAGVAYLVTDRLAESISALEKAARDSQDPHVWNDLAAARYALAVHDERPQELAEALADADRALSLTKLPEALFNRALIIEALGLREQAQRAWQVYLEADGGSAWAVEAREHIRKLSAAKHFDPKRIDQMVPEELVREFPQEARISGEGPLLAAWADDASETKLARVRGIGVALAAKGEHFLGDAVAAIDGADRDGRAALADAHRLYRDARIEYRKRDVAAAERDFRRSSKLFDAARSPMALAASYYAANTIFDSNRPAEAREALITLRARVPADRYRALAAQIGWELAVIANAEGNWGTAAHEAGDSAAAFRILGERANAAFVDQIGAIAIEMMGDPDLAWKRRIDAMPDLQHDAARSNANLRSEAMTLASTDHGAAALALLGLPLDDWRRGDPAALVFALIERSRMAIRSGDAGLARQSIAEAHGATPRIAAPALRELAEAEAALAGAVLENEAQPIESLQAFNRAAEFFTEHGQTRQLPDLYLERGRAYRAAGDARAALSDFEKALSEARKQQETIRDPELRRWFLDTAARAFEETIDLHLAGGNVAEAFAVANRAHRAGETDASFDATGLPDGTVIVEYAFLPRSVVAFSVTNRGVAADRIVVERRELVDSVHLLAGSIQRRAPFDQVTRESAAIYATLIAPLRSRLVDCRDLVIVPDRQLQALPFAALYDGGRRRFLVEDFTIRLAGAAGNGPALHESLTPALVVSDPRTPGEPRLARGRDEAGSIASSYNATLLEGSAATSAAFRQAVLQSALIHYAGHARSAGQEPFGALLLSDAEGDSGVLDAGEIATLALKRNPLVVLAACGTLRGGFAHLGGQASVARSFLLAGARGVIGTLWEVEDDVSSDFFVRFHDHLRSGASPAQALRETQLAMLHSADARLRHPATWCPIELLTTS